MNLVDCFASCFELVDAVLHGGGPTPDDLRAEASGRIERGVIMASAEFTPAAMLRARRIMAMWMDDRLGSDDRAGGAAWRENPLLPEGGEGAGAYLLELAGRLDNENDEDGQIAMLMLECLGRGFNLEKSRRDGLLGLLAERFKGGG